VYWVDWYGYEIITDISLTGGSLTPQPIITNGTALVYGVDAMFHYNPAGFGDRPVWKGWAYSAAWAAGCQMVAGKPQVTLVLGGS
jgi:hypothetical protein